MPGGGEFPYQEECDAARRTPWLQDGEGHRDCNIGSKFGVAVGGDRAQTTVTGFPRRVEGVLFPG